MAYLELAYEIINKNETENSAQIEGKTVV